MRKQFNKLVGINHVDFDTLLALEYLAKRLDVSPPVKHLLLLHFFCTDHDIELETFKTLHDATDEWGGIEGLPDSFFADNDIALLNRNFSKVIDRYRINSPKYKDASDDELAAKILAVLSMNNLHSFAREDGAARDLYEAIGAPQPD